MDAKNLYIIRYRKGMTGVQTAFITASSNARAEALGHFWCNGQVNCRFIQVIPAVIADESELPEELPVTEAAAKKPSAAAKKPQDLKAKAS